MRVLGASSYYLIFLVLLRSVGSTAVSTTELSDEARKAYTQLTIRHDESTIFSDGEIKHPWMAPLSENATEFELGRLFHHNEYADRIEFEMKYGPSETYAYGEPRVSSSDESIAKPSIIEYEMNADENSAKFAIAYDCRSRPTSARVVQLRSAVITVYVPVLSGISIIFALRKTCGGGIHPSMEFGVYRIKPRPYNRYSEGKKEERVEFAKAQGYIAGPEVISSRLYIHLKSPALTQEFFRPHVGISKPTILQVSLKGPSLGGVLRSGESAIFHILYECRQSGVTRISVIIPIAPFRPLRAIWTKDCGGGKINDFQIGSSDFNSGDILKSGEKEIGDPYSLTYSELFNHQSHIFILNGTNSYKDFYLSNSGENLLILDKPTYTIDKPKVLSVYTGKPNILGLYSSMDYSTRMESKSRRRMRSIFVCKRKGIAQVLITIIVRGYTPIEFGLRKVCEQPSARRQHVLSFLTTANSVMNLSFLLVISIMFLSCKRMLRGDYGLSKGGKLNGTAITEEKALLPTASVNGDNVLNVSEIQEGRPASLRAVASNSGVSGVAKVMPYPALARKHKD